MAPSTVKREVCRGAEDSDKGSRSSDQVFFCGFAGLNATFAQEIRHAKNGIQRFAEVNATDFRLNEHLLLQSCVYILLQIAHCEVL